MEIRDVWYRGLFTAAASTNWILGPRRLVRLKRLERLERLQRRERLGRKAGVEMGGGKGSVVDASRRAMLLFEPMEWIVLSFAAVCMGQSASAKRVAGTMDSHFHMSRARMRDLRGDGRQRGTGLEAELDQSEEILLVGC